MKTQHFNFYCTVVGEKSDKASFRVVDVNTESGAANAAERLVKYGIPGYHVADVQYIAADGAFAGHIHSVTSHDLITRRDVMKVSKWVNDYIKSVVLEETD